jgi:hypothetical protein
MPWLSDRVRLNWAVRCGRRDMDKPLGSLRVLRQSRSSRCQDGGLFEMGSNEVISFRALSLVCTVPKASERVRLKNAQGRLAFETCFLLEQGIF